MISFHNSSIKITHKKCINPLISPHARKEKHLIKTNLYIVVAVKTGFLLSKPKLPFENSISKEINNNKKKLSLSDVNIKLKFVVNDLQL